MSRFDPQALLDALPRQSLARSVSGVSGPRRGSPSARAYNGFSAKERGRTSALAKWLQDESSMLPPITCDVCARPASQHHAEDYYDFETWIAICPGCHGILHKRFENPSALQRRLDRYEVSASHWTRLVSPEPFDLAAYLRDRGAVEPTYESLLPRVAKLPRRPRQDFYKMGLKRGDRLTYTPAPEEVVTVEASRLVAWRGQVHSLTALTTLLAERINCSPSAGSWRAGKRSLNDLYDDTYGDRA